MIKTIEQATRVQAQRKAKGLKGRSKAVRRFMKRESIYSAHTRESINEMLPANFIGCRDRAQS